ncbi:asparaginase [Holzapfeliella sp. He02]|uniref:asparaginase n=1 Tax=Holzapfeliella saturejae TaxID=3082953 RepID=A0ABU8SFJ9_9LACO
MKKILVLHTGGTISMSENEAGEVIQNEQNPLLNLTHHFDFEIELVVEDIFNLPSPHIAPKHMLQLKKRIQKGVDEEGIDGVVITHGTDTLEETAYFLDLTLPNNLPVVLTGAMRSSNEIGSDGLHNFQSAILTAASDNAKNKGVLIVMNDEVHTARYVTKTHTTNVATFRTPTFGPIGLISKNRVHFFQELIAQTTAEVTELTEEVFLVKAYAGMSPLQFELLDHPKTKGVVIEALGAGNLPPQTLPAIQNLLDKNIPIVLVSRCFNGIAEDVYHYVGGGVELKEMGVIFCRGLNGQKARIKLLVGLSAGMQGDELAEFVNNATS